MTTETTTAGNRKRQWGFTLIELLVVIAIIALLISIMMPSLSQARAQARAVQCATNLHHVGMAMTTYTTEYGSYPVSYIYASNPVGSEGIAYDLYNQEQYASKPNGYIHWSYYLYSSGKAKPKSFQCPDFPNGGAPRTFPGPKGADWEPGQVDDHGKSGSSAVEDRQAPRIAYTANAAVVPRNKFSTQASGGPRINRFVKDAMLGEASSVILATEFINNWKAVGIPQGSGVLVKSHRSIHPFYHLGTGTDEYKAPLDNGSFTYGDRKSPTLGLRPYNELRDKVGVIEGSAGIEVNVVGRHHPGGTSKEMGGTANFLFCDSHVERTTILKTLQERWWGDRYYSLTGANKILK